MIKVALVVVATFLAASLVAGMALTVFQPDARQYDLALQAFDRLSMLEAALNRDVLSARFGLLRDYDPLTHELDALQSAAADLRQKAAMDPQILKNVEALSSTVTAERELIEHFKTDNALLQNSLAYFALFSTQLNLQGRPAELAPYISALTSAMLHLTLDTSPNNIADVDDRLRDLRGAPMLHDQADAMAALVAHGQILRDALPRVDETLQQLRLTPASETLLALRNIIVQRQETVRERARQYSLYLYAVCVLLAGALVHLGLMLRDRARRLRRRAAIEHVIAGLSLNLIRADSQKLAEYVELALADLAQIIGADRAYLVVASPLRRSFLWHGPNGTLPHLWPSRAMAIATEINHGIPGILIVRGQDARADKVLGETLRDVAVTDWVCVSNPRGMGTEGILGFDYVRSPCRIKRRSEVALLRTAYDTVASAIQREALELERARLETRLQGARRMETVGSLASGIAHNFNNIVGAILGYVEMAEASAAGSDGLPSHLAEIRRAGERAQGLIGHILTFGRRREIQSQPVRLDMLVDESVSMLRASFSAEQILSVSSVPAQAIVLGDATQLQQVLLNLVRNAIQATGPHGDVTIAVDIRDIGALRRLSHGQLNAGAYVVMSVTDSGHGISDDLQKRIFEPFFTTRPEGNGFGLATVREIVREHGGTMHLVSTPGLGTHFEVWLPLIETETAVPREASRLKGLPFGEGQVVLLVSADRDRLQSSEELLAALGYEPVGFSGLEPSIAVGRAGPERFDVALVGPMTDGLSVLDATARLRKALPGLPFIMAKAFADDFDVESLLGAEFAEVVAWPLDIREVAEALERISSRSSNLAGRSFERDRLAQAQGSV